MTDWKKRKRELRRQALARRDALDLRWRIEASLAMAEMARRHILIEPGDIVSGFWPMRSEVDVRPLMFALREHGARLCLPAISTRRPSSSANWCAGGDLIDTGFGTSGPGPEAGSARSRRSCWCRLRPSTRGATASAMAPAITIARSRGCMPPGSRRAWSASPSTARKSSIVPDEPHDVILPEMLTETGLRRFSADNMEG